MSWLHSDSEVCGVISVAPVASGEREAFSQTPVWAKRYYTYASSASQDYISSIFLHQ